MTLKLECSRHGIFDDPNTHSDWDHNEGDVIRREDSQGRVSADIYVITDHVGAARLAIKGPAGYTHLDNLPMRGFVRMIQTIKAMNQRHQPA